MPERYRNLIPVSKGNRGNKKKKKPNPNFWSAVGCKGGRNFFALFAQTI
jgi:hypothetical protein